LRLCDEESVVKMKVLCGCFAAILVGLACADADAVTLEPVTVILTPSGDGSAATFRIKNESGARVAVRFRVVTRAIGPDEQELNTPADELFVVYPSRLSLESGGSASAKVQWRGPAKVDMERSYRFVAERVPLDAVSSWNDESNDTTMFRYTASLYVGAPISSPELIAFVTGAVGPDGRNGYSVEIRNVGMRHVIAAGARIVLSDEKAVLLSSEELKHLAGSNYLPGISRRIFIPKADAAVGKVYGAKVEYAKTY
jgi:P pilus assembly chaperone PapD